MNWTHVCLALGSYAVGVGMTVALGYPVVQYLKHELQEAQNRLLGAWEAGKVIPPRSDEPLEMALPPLPEDLRAYLDEWESSDSKLAVETTIRRMQAKGDSAAQIHNHFATERLRAE